MVIRRTRFKQPLVKRRIIHVQGRPKTAQWKVAYADFVTALMAFFLLLWLISATTPVQKQSIAEYFTPTYGLGQSMGVGENHGKKSMDEGQDKSDLSPVGLVSGKTLKGTAEDIRLSALGDEKTKPAQAVRVAPKDLMLIEGELRNVKEGVKQALEEDPAFVNYRQSLLLQDTPEGLKLIMLDEDDNRLFKSKTAEFTDYGNDMVKLIAGILKSGYNYIAIHGHTPTRSTSAKDKHGDWEMSIARAAAVRRGLEQAGVDQSRFIQVVGVADKEPLVASATASSRNRRIAVMLVHSLGGQAVSARTGQWAEKPEPTPGPEKKNTILPSLMRR